MVQRRVIAGVEGINLVAAVRTLALAEQHRIIQLKAFALVVIEGELHDCGGIDDKYDEMEDHQHEGEHDQDIAQPAKRRGRSFGKRRVGVRFRDGFFDWIDAEKYQGNAQQCGCATAEQRDLLRRAYPSAAQAMQRVENENCSSPKYPCQCNE